MGVIDGTFSCRERAMFDSERWDVTARVELAAAKAVDTRCS